MIGYCLYCEKNQTPIDVRSMEKGEIVILQGYCPVCGEQLVDLEIENPLKGFENGISN